MGKESEANWEKKRKWGGRRGLNPRPPESQSDIHFPFLLGLKHVSGNINCENISKLDTVYYPRSPFSDSAYLGCTAATL